MIYQLLTLLGLSGRAAAAASQLPSFSDYSDSYLDYLAALSEYTDKWKNCDKIDTDFYDENMPSILSIPRSQEMNFDVGKGVDYLTGTAKQSPFHMKDYTKKTSDAADSDRIGQQIINSAESFERYIDARASISGSGWGVKAGASIAAGSNGHYESNQVVLIAYREIKYGIDGMVDGNLPPFTDEAKDFLCMDPNAFAQIYGTHFVKGEVKGASIDMKTVVTTEDQDSAKNFATEVEASGGFAGISAEASASLERTVNQSKEVKSSNTLI